MKVLAVFFIVLSLFSISSCTRSENLDCRDILSAIISSEIGLPSGEIYSARAEIGEEEYLSDHLVNSLYGNGKEPVMADGWIDIAIFLPSSAHPCEFAVILCDSEDTSSDTARMLCRRLDTIRTSKADETNSVYFDTATVTVMRNYVLLVISSDSATALKLASKMIR